MKQLKCVKPETAAELLDVKVETLEAWRRRGVGPRFLRLGSERGRGGRGAIRYRIIDLEAFQESALRSSTTDTGSASTR